jgi:UPF0716 protein FxsA
MISRQRLTTLRATQDSLDAGPFPAAAVFDGVFLLFAGGLLLFPGFVSDGLAALLLIPALRRLLQRWLVQHLAAAGGMRVWTSRHPRDSQDVLIDGDFEIVPAEPPSAPAARPGRGLEHDPATASPHPLDDQPPRQ